MAAALHQLLAAVATGQRVEQAWADAVARLEKYLRHQGLVDDAFVAEAKAEGERLAADLRERMNLDPETHPDDLFRHVYATLTPQLREQRAMLHAELDADAESDSQAAHDPSTEDVR